MSEPDLPQELTELELIEMERELRHAFGHAPGASLRGRVLAAMRAEMRAGVRAGRTTTLSFLAGTAAAALLWINLSMSLVNNTWQVSVVPADDGLDEVAGRMRALMPELSSEEARRQAATALARTALAPAGALPVPVYARNEPWDTH